MYLHEQRVIVLQQGLAVFRSAMTIRLNPEARAEKYTSSHYAPLQHHYGERVLQVHAQVFIRTDDDAAQHMRMFLYQIRR